MFAIVVLLLGAFALYIIRGLTKVKVRMAYVDGKRAARAESAVSLPPQGTKPKWYENMDKIFEFEDGINEKGIARGLPKSYIYQCLNKDDFAPAFLSYVAMVEQCGATFDQQILRGVHMLEEGWLQFSPSDQQFLRDLKIGSAAI